MVLLQFLVGLSLYIIPKQILKELEDPKDYSLLSEVKSLNEQGTYELGNRREGQGYHLWVVMLTR